VPSTVAAAPKAANASRGPEQTIQANHLNVRFIVGGHGTVVPYAQFRAAIGQPLPGA